MNWYVLLEWNGDGYCDYNHGLEKLDAKNREEAIEEANENIQINMIATK